MSKLPSGNWLHNELENHHSEWICPLNIVIFHSYRVHITQLLEIWSPTHICFGVQNPQLSTLFSPILNLSPILNNCIFQRDPFPQQRLRLWNSSCVLRSFGFQSKASVMLQNFLATLQACRLQVKSEWSSYMGFNWWLVYNHIFVYCIYIYICYIHIYTYICIYIYDTYGLQ